MFNILHIVVYEQNIKINNLTLKMICTDETGHYNMIYCSFLLYWALNVSIREAMTLKIIRKLARSMFYIYLFQLIIIIRRCMLFYIY